MPRLGTRLDFLLFVLEMGLRLRGKPSLIFLFPFIFNLSPFHAIGTFAINLLFFIPCRSRCADFTTNVNYELIITDGRMATLMQDENANRAR